MRINKWKCDKCGVEFEGFAHHHEEFDLCDTCHTMLMGKRTGYDTELNALRPSIGEEPKEIQKI